MKFLDLNGLNHLLTKIKASFGTAIVNSSDYKTEIDDKERINIPFVANHQIVNMNYLKDINVYNWFQGASKGGILEITGVGLGNTFCRSDNGDNYMYKTTLVAAIIPTLLSIDFLQTSYNTYARLIKIDDDKLIVAIFYQNKEK